MKNRYRKNNNQCIDCKTEIDDRAKRCKVCSMKNIVKNLIKHPSYIDGRTLKKHYCIDCNKKISYISKRCPKCAGKIQSPKMMGTNNPRKSKYSEIEAIKNGKILGWMRWFKFRDNILQTINKCQLCNSTKILSLHHIKEKEKYPELFFDKSNILVICKKCHWIIHFVKDKEIKILNKYLKIIKK